MKKYIFLIFFAIIFSGCSNNEDREISSLSSSVNEQKIAIETTDANETTDVNEITATDTNETDTNEDDEKNEFPFFQPAEIEKANVISLKPGSSLDSETANKFIESFNKYSTDEPRNISSDVCHETGISYSDYNTYINEEFDIDWNSMAVYQACQYGNLPYLAYDALNYDIPDEDMKEHLLEIGFEDEAAEYGVNNYKDDERFIKSKKNIVNK